MLQGVLGYRVVKFVQEVLCVQRCIVARGAINFFTHRPADGFTLPARFCRQRKKYNF